ncbi:pirin family protein [Paenibacillus xanthanilyticus]|uniref:Pirin family protein n=1 Tax=Paenibacillus xanthanilyticus TaxID=1783531 RepID=A0ABV8K8P9_9BACL
MVQILYANQTPTMGAGGPFQIRRIRPGKAAASSRLDGAFGPLSVVDHATLRANNTVPMHEHRNDEILSYFISGKIAHLDSSGAVNALSRNVLMLMNAGSGFSHEETNMEETLEALQIFVRPQEQDLPPGVQFYARPADYANGTWQFIAGPEGSGAPLIFRNQVMMYDIHAREGEELRIPEAEGMSPFVYIMRGSVEVEGHALAKGDGFIVDDDDAPPILRTDSPVIIVVFLVDRKAKASTSGTISGW